MTSRESNHAASVIAAADIAARVLRAWSDFSDATNDIPPAAEDCIRLEAVAAARRCGVSPAPAALIDYLRTEPSVIDAGLARWQRELKARREEAAA